MGGFAGLAGAMGGLQKGWDDNREEIKAQAEMAFKAKLEQARIDSGREDMATKRGYEKEDQKAAGLVAAEQRKWDAQENQKDRQARIDASAARAGGKTAGKLPLNIQAAFKVYEELSGLDNRSPDQEEQLKESYSVIQPYLGAKEAEPEIPTNADIDLLKRKPGIKNSWIKKFGQEAYNAVTGSAQPETIAEQPKKKESGGRGLIASMGSAVPGLDEYVKERAAQSADVLDTINQAVAGGDPVDNYIPELTEIAQNQQLDDAMREEARQLLTKMKNPLRY